MAGRANADHLRERAQRERAQKHMQTRGRKQSSTAAHADGKARMWNSGEEGSEGRRDSEQQTCHSQHSGSARAQSMMPRGPALTAARNLRAHGDVNMAAW